MRTDPFPVKGFTDDTVKAAYAAAGSALAAATTDEQRISIKAAADQQRNNALERGPLLSAAFTYLTLAQANITVGTDDPEKLHHFAANAFRDLGLLQRAAECYFNSALAGYTQYTQSGQGNAAFARRSAGRAKALFAELGDDENSGDSHLLQQRIKLEEHKRAGRWALFSVYKSWDVASEFGTSPSKWLKSTLVVVVLFAVLYPLLIALGQITVTGDIHQTGVSLLTSSLVFSIGNLFQFGTLGTLTPVTWIGQLAVILHGIIAFVLVGTGATFLTRS